MQVWVNGDDHKNVLEIAKNLQKAVETHKSAELKGFLIVVVDDSQRETVSKHLVSMADEHKLDQIGITYLPKGDGAVKAYKVNLDPEVKNTVFLYRRKRVEEKFVNFKADEKGLTTLGEALKNLTATR